jgi:hypothetical protein
MVNQLVAEEEEAPEEEEEEPWQLVEKAKKEDLESN